MCSRHTHFTSSMTLLPAETEWAVHQGSLLLKVAHLSWVARVALVGKPVTDTAETVADAALETSSCQVRPLSDERKQVDGRS